MASLKVLWSFVHCTEILQRLYVLLGGGEKGKGDWSTYGVDSCGMKVFLHLTN